MPGFKEVEEVEEEQEAKRVSRDRMRELNKPKERPRFPEEEEEEMPGDDDPELDEKKPDVKEQAVYRQGFNDGFVQASSLAFQAMIGLTKKEVR